MIDQGALFNSVFIMFLMIIPGFLMRKSHLADGALGKGLANTILYATQPAMIITAFVRDYDANIMRTAAAVFLFSFIAHLLFYIIARQCFKKTPLAQKKVLQFALVFSNAGYLGIPLLRMAFPASPEVVMYAAVYCICFNVFTWSLGALIFTDDKKYINAKHILLNPASIPTYIGILIFLLPIKQYIPTVINEGMNTLAGAVAPLAMIMIGLRLAEVSFRSVFTDWRMLPFLAMRHFLLPALIWVIMKLLVLAGVGFIDDMVMKVILICSATPAAAATGIFAEKFNGDTVYASKIVSISTVLSLATIPIVALLLNI